ncbi:MAG: ATP synthase F1 subunit gamma [Longimicrobiales bacterium]|jgi:F-type H+-transporting ATPase subunit gamma|nr:ATP synthase F1 subunit gamma [Longimicrobiales bacterium]
MAGARDVKRRIKSVENTRQITRTMELVATSKLKKSTDRVSATRPYGESIVSIVENLCSPDFVEKFPLLRKPDECKKAAVLLLTADRGLAGGFNANLIKEANNLLDVLKKAGTEASLHIVGKKGIAYFRFRGHPIASEYVDLGDAPTVESAGDIIGPLGDAFSSGEIDAVYVVSSKFRSAVSTPPTVLKLLPVEPAYAKHKSDDFILTPNAGIILQTLLPLYLRNSLYRALVENVAAEQGSRRTAMKNATDNAGDVLEHLTRTYNRARQGQITQEIAEIVGGAAALE